MNDTPPPALKAVPLSLRRKSSSRVAAVQCLYQRNIMGDTTPAEALLTGYLDQWKDDKDSDPRILSRDADPDAGFLRKLLTGVLEHQSEIDQIVTASLNDKWTVARMSPLLIAILSCAIYEMKYSLSLKAPIIIDEYVTLTGRFFEAPEIGFVNGLLDTLAKQFRSVE